MKTTLPNVEVRFAITITKSKAEASRYFFTDVIFIKFIVASI